MRLRDVVKVSMCHQQGLQQEARWSRPQSPCSLPNSQHSPPAVCSTIMARGETSETRGSQPNSEVLPGKCRRGWGGSVCLNPCPRPSLWAHCVGGPGLGGVVPLETWQALWTRSGVGGAGNWGGATRSSAWSQDILSSQPDSALCAFERQQRISVLSPTRLASFNLPLAAISNYKLLSAL